MCMHVNASIVLFVHQSIHYSGIVKSLRVICEYLGVTYLEYTYAHSQVRRNFSFLLYDIFAFCPDHHDICMLARPNFLNKTLNFFFWLIIKHYIVIWLTLFKMSGASFSFSLTQTKHVRNMFLMLFSLFSSDTASCILFFT